MTASAPLALFAALLALAPGDAGAGEDATPADPSLVGIDHVCAVVESLEAATVSYERFGFAVKPGRRHADGLRNAHVKFRDGSGVELISPPVKPTDDLTRTYAAFLRGGEGPAFLAFHARDTGALTAALTAAGIPFTVEGEHVRPTGPDLGFLFFVRDNRSPTDRPAHFAHANTAFAMTEVWLALDDGGRESLRRLLVALGAVEGAATVPAPSAVRAQVFQVRNGRVVVVPDTSQARKGRPIIGVAFRVASLPAARRILGADAATVAPSAAHGLWLRLDQRP